MKVVKTLFFFSLILFWSCKKDNLNSVCDRQIDQLGMNQFQYLNSHNSYRMRTYEPIYNFVDKALGVFSKYQQPAGWDYSNESLEDQFNKHNIRSIELDLFYDPDGGHYYHRQANRLVSEPTASSIPELNEPGFKIMNQPDFDYMTHHYTFKSALTAVKNWSDRHDNHLPITILVEPKDQAYVSAVTQALSFLTKPKLITPAVLDAVDREIKEVFGNDLKKVITPDKIRKNHETLETAILTDGWPTIKESRGKVLFILKNSGFERAFYLDNHPSLENRVMFTFSDPGKDDCAFIKIDNPERKLEDIQAMVAQGYMVRTLADNAPKEAKNGEEDRKNAAMASGAQIITTAYYRADDRHESDENWTDYEVQFETGERAILNPINGDSTIVNCPIRE